MLLRSMAIALPNKGNVQQGLAKDFDSSVAESEALLVRQNPKASVIEFGLRSNLTGVVDEGADGVAIALDIDSELLSEISQQGEVNFSLVSPDRLNATFSQHSIENTFGRFSGSYAGGVWRLQVEVPAETDLDAVANDLVRSWDLTIRSQNAGGTALAGIAAANDSEGIVGVSPWGRLAGLRLLGDVDPVRSEIDPQGSTIANALLDRSNVTIAIVDNGFDYQHADLANWYRAGVSFDFTDNDFDPLPTSTHELSGTFGSTYSTWDAAPFAPAFPNYSLAENSDGSIRSLAFATPSFNTNRIVPDEPTLPELFIKPLQSTQKLYLTNSLLFGFVSQPQFRHSTNGAERAFSPTRYWEDSPESGWEFQVFEENDDEIAGLRNSWQNNTIAIALGETNWLFPLTQLEDDASGGLWVLQGDEFDEDDSEIAGTRNSLQIARFDTTISDESRIQPFYQAFVRELKNAALRALSDL